MATTKTIKASGGDYTSLAAWEGAMDGDLTGTGYSEAVCYAIDDVDSVVINGWTTTADDYIYIHTDSTARHVGVWNGDKYNLITTNAEAITNNENYVRIDGLQVSTSAVNATGQDVIGCATIGASNDLRFSNLILRGAYDATYYQRCLSLADSDITAYVWNCIMYGITASGLTSANIIYLLGTNKLYSITGVGGTYGIYGSSGSDTTAKNCFFGGSYTEDFFGTVLAKTNCASEDQSADDTGATETATNCVAASVPVSTATFVNVTPGSEDFHLAADGLSPLQGAGWIQAENQPP